jgi:hypothetical protein
MEKIMKKNILKTLSILSVIAAIQPACAGYHDGDLHNAWCSEDEAKLNKVALEAISHLESPNQPLFDFTATNSKNTTPYTITWTYKDTHGLGLGELSGSLENIKINKQEGYTQFSIRLGEGYFGGSATVKCSYRFLTQNGLNYFKQNQNKK